MSIISKETWDKFTQEEKEKIKQDYQNIIEAKRKISFTNDEISGAKYQMELIFGKENLQPQPKLTYEDVARELFGKDLVKCQYAPVPCMGLKWNNKLQAMGRLLVIAKFLNKDWKPDWSDLESEKWSFGIDGGSNLRIEYSITMNGRIVYFPTKELAKQAIQILGEDTVRMALGNY